MRVALSFLFFLLPTLFSGRHRLTPRMTPGAWFSDSIRVLILYHVFYLFYRWLSRLTDSLIGQLPVARRLDLPRRGGGWEGPRRSHPSWCLGPPHGRIEEKKQNKRFHKKIYKSISDPLSSFVPRPLFLSVPAAAVALSRLPMKRQASQWRGGKRKKKKTIKLIKKPASCPSADTVKACGNQDLRCRRWRLFDGWCLTGKLISPSIVIRIYSRPSWIRCTNTSRGSTSSAPTTSSSCRTARSEPTFSKRPSSSPSPPIKTKRFVHFVALFLNFIFVNRKWVMTVLGFMSCR